MPLLDLDKITTGLSKTWAGYLRDWTGPCVRPTHPEATRYNHLLAAAQLARCLAEHSPDPDAEDAADDQCEVTKGHVEAFQAWLIDTRSAATALNKHKGLQQFFEWLMGRRGRHRLQHRCPPVRGRQPQARRPRREHRLGALPRQGQQGPPRPFRPKTARALSRYLRARAKHKRADLPDFWLADRGVRRLAPNGIKIMLKRCGLAAGLNGVHAHHWRHNLTHEWKKAGGDTSDIGPRWAQVRWSESAFASQASAGERGWMYLGRFVPFEHNGQVPAC